jgi:DNA (cytosine-5)-methyltransferase 1
MNNVALRPQFLSLCSGVGMLDLAVHLAFNARTVCYVEREAFAASQLVALMEAGCLDQAPIWSDLATFDGLRWRGKLDGLVAGLPCQPYSLAGRQEGNDDKRSWGEGDGPIPHALRIIDESRPTVVCLENVSAWITGGFFQPVAERLCALGYRIAGIFFLAAEDVGASHKRKRVFVMAYAEHDARGAEFWIKSWQQFAARAQQDPVFRARCAAGDVAESEGGRFGELRQPPGCEGGRPSDGIDQELADPAWHGRDGQGRQSGRGWGVRETSGTAADAGDNERRVCFARARQEERTAVGGPGSDVGDTDRERELQSDDQNRAEPRGEPRGEPRLRACGSGCELANACGARREIAESPELRGSRGRAEGRATRELCGPFAPGPTDPRWGDIIREFPWLAPATEPGVCLLADGLTVVVDESRRHQLRATGNGAVPLAAAVAFSVLAREAGLI